jgi:hypothetical protein
MRRLAMILARPCGPLDLDMRFSSFNRSEKKNRFTERLRATPPKEGVAMAAVLWSYSLLSYRRNEQYTHRLLEVNRMA